MANITNVMSFVVGGLSLLVFIVGIFGYKLIGIQMMGVIQISYLSLISLSPVNPSFKALSNLWLVNGVNYFYFTKEYLKDVHSPVQAKSMFMSSQFIKNYNLTMIIILTPIAIGLSYMILSLLRSKSSLRLGKKIICEYGFDGIMFSLYIISFSFSLQVLYGVKNMDQSGKISIFICILMLILIIVYFVLIVCVP